MGEDLLIDALGRLHLPVSVTVGVLLLVWVTNVARLVLQFWLAKRRGSPGGGEHFLDDVRVAANRDRETLIVQEPAQRLAQLGDAGLGGGEAIVEPLIFAGVAVAGSLRIIHLLT